GRNPTDKPAGKSPGKPSGKPNSDSAAEPVQKDARPDEPAAAQSDEPQTSLGAALGRAFAKIRGN
ncbi:MAG: hypothetical protein OER92_07140, partial [Alphaproteobacteria bacterium]|nr:hypothetical protein [Alphaproteobacteria bacterium]